MAIAPVSSVSFRNTQNQVHFEGKKERKNHSGISNTIKAIPLATLIALSPLNTVEAQNMRINNGKYESTIMQDGTIYGSFVEPKGVIDPSDYDCEVMVTCMPDGDDIADEISLRYTRPSLKSPGQGKRGLVISNIQVNAIKVVNVTEDNQNGVINKYKEYYVVGDLTKVDRVLDKNTNKLLSNKVSKRQNVAIRVSDNFYRKIEKMAGDNMDRRVENVTRDTSNSYYYGL